MAKIIDESIPTVAELTKMPYTITLDDDPIPARIIEETLGLKNFWFTSSSLLRDTASKFEPMGAFVDIHLEDECGLDIVPVLRTIWPTTAIIVMTGDEDDSLIGQALGTGADDFIRKPMSPSEVLARLKVRIEDLKDKNGQTFLRYGDVRLDIKHRSLLGPLGKTTLSVREVELMADLIRANGVVVPREVLKRELWGNVSVSDNAVDRKIFEVRKALREVSKSVELQSIYGVGIVLRLRTFAEDIQILEGIESRIRSAQSP